MTLRTNAVIISCLAAVTSLPCRAQMQNSPSIHASLVGTWKLTLTEEKLRDGRTRPYPDLGDKATGFLMYGADGRMCVAMMKPGRPQWKNDQENASDAEKVSAGSGFTSYCGRYEVDERNRVITHFPEVSFYPNFIGTVQKRPYRLQGNRLTFSDVVSSGEVERWTIACSTIAVRHSSRRPPRLQSRFWDWKVCRRPVISSSL